MRHVSPLLRLMHPERGILEGSTKKHGIRTGETSDHLVYHYLL